MDYSKVARQFKALSDENRLQIIVLLQNGEKCACKLLEELPIGQSTLSHHMKILCDAGVVVGRRDGKWTHYSLNKLGCADLQHILMQLLYCNGKTGVEVCCKQN